MKLYTYFRSSAAYRVRIGLNLKGLNAEHVPVHLVNNGGEQHSESYRQINPSGAGAHMGRAGFCSDSIAKYS